MQKLQRINRVPSGGQARHGMQIGVKELSFLACGKNFSNEWEHMKPHQNYTGKNVEIDEKHQRSQGPQHASYQIRGGVFWYLWIWGCEEILGFLTSISVLRRKKI